MALFRIHREVGAISQEEMDAAAFRAIVCAPQFTGMKWLRSYWDRPGGYMDCFYEAASIRDIEEHSRVARIPCDQVYAVDELLPETYING